MKKWLCLLLTVVLGLGWVTTALAEDFDYTVLEGLEGYSYDKFDKEWRVYGVYTNSKATVAFVINGNQKEVNDAITLLVIVDKSDCAIPATLDFLIDETVYSIPLYAGADHDGAGLLAFEAEDAALIIQALSDAEEVSVRVSGSEGKVTFDIEKAEYASSDFKQWIDTVVQYQLWNYYSDEANSTANMWSSGVGRPTVR